MKSMSGADQLKTERLTQLTAFASRLMDSANAGLFSVRTTNMTAAQTPIAISRIVQIPGPRTGILELYAGYHNGTLANGLEANSMALLRQLLWDEFQGEPQVYLQGKAVRVEAGWPSELTTSEIRLSELHQMPPSSGRFVLGQNILGQTVTIGLDSEKAHAIIAGTTGSGKSVTLRTIIFQLALDGDALILIDGKLGEGVQGLDRLPNVLGPIATTSEEAQRALAYGAVQMIQRYKSNQVSPTKIVIVVDEVQEFRNDPIVVELLRKVASQGRGAGVHLILATQHPTNDVIGDPTIKRNATLRIGLKVTDVTSSQAVMGNANPRLDYLLGQGDCWSQTPRALHRLQVAMLEPKILKTKQRSKPLMPEWPDLSETLQEIPDLLDLEGLTKPTTTRAIQFSGRQIGLAVLGQARHESRAALIRELEKQQIPVSRKVSARLWELGLETLQTLQENNLQIPEGENS